MPLSLLIPDAALREAIIEQMLAAKMPAPRLCDNARACLKQSEGDAAHLVIVDQDKSDKELKEMLRAGDESGDRPVILTLGGADDSEGVSENFAKPLRLGHLIARLRYYLETAPLLRDRAVTFGPYRLEPKNRHIIHQNNAEPVRLTEKETALLVFLAHSPQPATRRDILAGVWGYGDNIDTHTLETHIYQLRRKLDAGGENWLINEAGAYRLARGLE